MRGSNICKYIFILGILFIFPFVSATTNITDTQINTSGNVTASYFIGNGSLLTGISADNSSWNESHADTLYYGLNNLFGFYNSTDFDISNYYTTENPFTYYNSTTIPSYITWTQITNGTVYLSSNPSSYIDWATATNGTLAEMSDVLGFNYYNSTDFSISDYYTTANPFAYYNSTTLTTNSQILNGNNYWNSTFALFNKTYADSLYAGIGSVGTSYLSKYTTGNFTGSLYTTGAESTSTSDSLFQVISDTRGTPQFQIQDGGEYQASFITRSFMVVNQNNTLLNSSQNNDCRDWGFIHADCNTATTGADFGVTDDIEAQGTIYANEGIRGHTSDHSAFIALAKIPFLHNGASGYFNDATNIFCDASSTFTTVDVWLIIQDESSEYHEAFAYVNSVVNSTCIELKYNPGWNSDFGPVKWVTKNNINLISQDGGYFGFNVGMDEESVFRIHIDNGTGFYGAYIDDTAGSNQHKAFTIDVDSKDYDGVIGQNIYMRSSTGVDGVSSQALNLEGDATGFSNSNLRFIDINLIGEGGSGNDVDVLYINGDNVDHIIHQGGPDTLISGFVESTDATANFISTATDSTMFVNDNDYVYIGSDTNFTSISVSLATTSSKNLNLLFYYCDATGDYQPLTSITDTTGGMTTSGSINFVNPTDRGVCNTEYDGTLFSDTTNYTYIAMKRTTNNIVVKPIEDIFSISGSSTYFFLSSDTIKLNGISTPDACDGSMAGGIYFDTDTSKHYGCDGSTWNAMY